MRVMAELFGAIGTLVLVACINGALIMANLTMGAMASQDGYGFAGYGADTDNVLCQQAGGCDAQGAPVGLNQQVQGGLPASKSGTTPTGSGTFTDLWNTVSSWVIGPGKFLLGIVAPLPMFFVSIGLSGALKGFAVVIGVMWEAFSILVIINFIRGT